MDILQVSPYNISPPNSGGDERSHGLVYPLVDTGINVIRYCINGLVTKIYETTTLGDLRLRRCFTRDGVIECQPNNLILDIPSAGGFVLFPQLRLYLASRLLEQYFPRKLQTLCDWADAIFVERPWFVQTIADYTDSHIVYSAHDVAVDLYDSILDEKFGRRWFLQKVEAIEASAVSAADLVITVSEADLKRYREKYDFLPETLVIPNSVQEAKFKSGGQTYTISDGIDAVFVGSDRQPNIEAVEKLIGMAEEVRDDHPDFTLSLVGDVAANFDQEAHDYLTTVGFVDELIPTLASYDLALNPIESGGGSNIKLIDYCAAGLPILSTEFGVRGFDFVSDTHVLVRKLSEFPDVISHLSNHPNERARLANMAYQHARNHYTWESHSETLLERVREL